MYPAEVDSPYSTPTHRKLKSPWWADDTVFKATTTASKTTSLWTYRYHLGDSDVEICTDEPALLDSLEQYYGECAIIEAGIAPFECSVRGDIHSQLIWVEYTGIENLPGIALRLLHPPPGEPSYTIKKAIVPGWQLLGGSETPVVAACERGILFDFSLVPKDFLAEFIIAVSLAAQPNIIALHAASLQIGNSGILLTGTSRAGKTTTSLHLATRGHALLGDEISAIRLATRELTPIRKSLSLRTGPRSPALSATLKQLPARADLSESKKIGPYRIDELFPKNSAKPVRLTTAFFLIKKASQPALEPFQLTLDQDSIFEYMAANDAVSVSWGLTPIRRAMRLLALNQIMNSVNCWTLTVGPPEATAELIEQCVNGEQQ